jgi:CheY-like chemotaxis protein
VTRKPILLVDDDDDFIEITLEQLSALSFDGLVSVARDGVQALDFLRKRPPFERSATPALVILDIKMPRKDGHQVLEEMHADPVLRSIPVVMMTCSAMQKDRERAMKAGAALFLTKVVQTAVLKGITDRFARE